MARKYHPTEFRGPAAPSEKALRTYFDEIGMREQDIPAELRNKVVARSRRGPVGAIVVRKMTGLENNNAAQVVRRFEANVGGKEEVAEKVAASGTIPPEMMALVQVVRGGTKKTLARLIAEHQIEPIALMRQYARGCVEMGIVEAAIAAHKDLPRVVKDLVAHALDREAICKVCVGSGAVKRHQNYEKDTEKCPACGGSGTTIESSPHKQWAARAVLEMTKQVGGKEGVTVNVQQNTALISQGGFLEKTLLANEEILNPRPKAEVVDAEVVK